MSATTRVLEAVLFIEKGVLTGPAIRERANVRQSIKYRWIDWNEIRIIIVNVVLKGGSSQCLTSFLICKSLEVNVEVRAMRLGRVYAFK
jgi:hypothetical protein